MNGTNSVDATNVAAGKLVLNGTFTSRTGTFNVSGTSTLGGTATITDSTPGAVNVVVAAGASLEPGTSVGTLTVDGDLDISATAGGAGVLDFELDTILASDAIDVTGTLTIGSGALGLSDFVFTDLGGLENGTYTLISSGAAVSGTLDGADTNGTLGLATIDLQISGSGTDIELVVSGLAGGDTTPPVWDGGYPLVDGVTSSGATARGQIDEDGTAYFVVVADGATAPTSAQVKAGNDASDSPAIDSGSIALTASTENTAAISGLSPGAPYDVYFVAEDDEGSPNLQTTPVKVDITTLTLFAEWSGGAGFEIDTNGDGISNGMAFLLGAAGPNADATGLLPTVSESGGDLILVFDCLAIADRGSAELRVEHSSDLGVGDPWEATVDEVPDSDDAVADNGVTFVVDEVVVDPLHRVTATIDSAEAGGSGRLFGRLEATE